MYGFSIKFQLFFIFLKTHAFLFIVSFTRSNVLYSPTLISHFHKLQSVSFQMVTRICISLLQVLSYRQLNMGMSFLAKIEKKVVDPYWTAL